MIRPSYSSTICLTLFHGMSLGFTFFHFPILGAGIGLYASLNCSGGLNYVFILVNHLLKAIAWLLSLSIFSSLRNNLIS